MAALKTKDRYLASQDIATKYPSDVDANGYFIGHPETEVDQVSDMASFMKTVNKQGSDASAVKTLIGIGSNEDGIPLGIIMPWTGSGSIPVGFLLCDGRAVSRTEYAALFNLIGTKYGSGDGSTTFNLPDLTDASIQNGSYTKTEYTTAGNATFTASKTGFYKITVKGAGGGGQGAWYISNSQEFGAGAGGGEGGTTISYEKMTAGDMAAVVVGTGGAGGAAPETAGANGGNSTVTVNLTTYTGGGGFGGEYAGGKGGDGTICGAPGCQAIKAKSAIRAGSGGGNGGSPAGVGDVATKATQGGGGGGGTFVTTSQYYAGGDGGDGFVTIEYIGASELFLIKYIDGVPQSEASAAASAAAAAASAANAQAWASSAVGIPLGLMLPYSANAQTPPAGFLYAEGQAVSRTMYADLFQLIGTTYGSGDGSTTFNLPDMRDRYAQGSTTAGTAKSAGLPEIEGHISSRNTDSLLWKAKSAMDPQGAFYVYSDGTKGIYTSAVANYEAAVIGIRASKYNAIYGNSDTVTPPTLTVRWIIKAYDAPTPSSAQIDLSQYASDLANRLTREMTPAFNKRDVITSSGTYTAPVTGWYRIVVKGGGQGGWGGGYNSSYAIGGRGGAEGGTSIGFEKLTAGDTIAIVIGAGGAGGAKSTSGAGSVGSAGGNTTATVNNNTYTGGGGNYDGGSGDIKGASATSWNFAYNTDSYGGQGAGAGGGSPTSGTAGYSGSMGGGGAGGYASRSSSPGSYNGGKGGNGYCWIEYFDPTLN